MATHLQEAVALAQQRSCEEALGGCKRHIEHKIADSHADVLAGCASPAEHAIGQVLYREVAVGSNIDEGSGHHTEHLGVQE